MSDLVVDILNKSSSLSLLDLIDDGVTFGVSVVDTLSLIVDLSSTLLLSLGLGGEIIFDISVVCTFGFVFDIPNISSSLSSSVRTVGFLTDGIETEAGGGIIDVVGCCTGALRAKTVSSSLDVFVVVVVAGGGCDLVVVNVLKRSSSELGDLVFSIVLGFDTVGIGFGCVFFVPKISSSSLSSC
ncbi:unnamed protein product [Rotaria sp. Silwood1]|nr:unnamed protein product [Rotaria sp. Silwood1]